MTEREIVDLLSNEEERVSRDWDRFRVDPAYLTNSMYKAEVDNLAKFGEKLDRAVSAFLSRERDTDEG